MKLRSLIFTLVFMIPAVSWAQSRSFKTLQGHFEGMNDVESFCVGGFVARLALSIADVPFDEETARGLNEIHVMIIPKHHFTGKGLTLHGYKRFISRKDGFHQLIEVKEGNSRVGVYASENNRGTNRFILLSEGEDDVVAIEFSGDDVDPTKWFGKDCDDPSI